MDFIWYGIPNKNIGVSEEKYGVFNENLKVSNENWGGWVSYENFGDL